MKPLIILPAATGPVIACRGSRRAPLASCAADNLPPTGRRLRRRGRRSVLIRILRTHPYLSLRQQVSALRPPAATAWGPPRSTAAPPIARCFMGDAAIALRERCRGRCRDKFQPGRLCRAVNFGRRTALRAVFRRPTSVPPLDHVRVRPGAMVDFVDLFFGRFALVFWGDFSSASGSTMPQAPLPSGEYASPAKPLAPPPQEIRRPRSR